MNIEELTNMFTYHPPFGDQEVRYSIIRDLAKQLAFSIEKWCPRSREKSLAITKLQECVMMANASIAIHEKSKVPEGEMPTLDSPEKEEQEQDEEAAADEREQIEAEEQNL